MLKNSDYNHTCLERTIQEKHTGSGKHVKLNLIKETHIYEENQINPLRK